jgi:acetyl esterase
LFPSTYLPTIETIAGEIAANQAGCDLHCFNRTELEYVMKKNSLLTILFTGAMIMSHNAPAQDIPDPTTDPRINHEVRDFIKSLVVPGSPFLTPFYQLPGDQPRTILSEEQNKTPGDMSGVTITEKVITQDDRQVKIYIMKPQNVKGTPPVLFFIHGGVWLVGDFDNHKRFVRDLVVGSGAIAVFPEYSPLPGAVYPTQIEEIYAAFKWTGAHGHELGADTSRIAIAGNSVGGNMAAVLAMLAKERGGPAIKLQVLFWPATDASVDTASYHEFATGRFLGRDFMKYGWDLYVPKEDQRNDPHVSPLRATVDQLRGLPPALIQTEENDPLRDEGEAYARKLDAADVPVIATRYIGQIHDFGILNGIRKVPSTQEAIRQASAVIKEYLNQ